MFCTNCGEQMRDTDKFCAECGNPAAPRSRRSRTAAVAEEPSAPVASAEPAAPAAARSADERRVLHSTAEPYRAPLPSPSASAIAPNQPELAFSASQPPATSTPVRQIPPAARPGQPPTSSEDEQRRVLLEAEEIASVRGMVPIDALPADFPAPATSPTRAATKQICTSCGKLNAAENHFCEGCGMPLQAAPPTTATAVQSAPSLAPPEPAYNAWLDVGGAKAPAPAPANPVSSPAAATPAQAAAQTAAKEESFFYYYDDTAAPKESRKLLVILLIVFAVGIAGIIFLLSRSPAKKAPAGNVTVAISPASADVVVGQAHDFAATVSGTGDTDVTWSVEEGSAGGKLVSRGAQAQGGTVANMAVYVAPSMPGTYHIVATSKADTTKSATAEVLVSGK